MSYTLITGASGGLGAALAEVFAKHKHNLILAARNETNLNKVKARLEDEYGIEIHIYAADLSIEQECNNMFEFTQSQNLDVDILINNAGFGYSGDYLDADWFVQKNMVDLNITTLMYLSYLYGNIMKKKAYGKILNIASAAAFSGGPYMVDYYATKAFVLSFSEALHEELKPFGITVTALCPGPTKTSFEKNAGLEQAKMFKSFGAANPKNVARLGYAATMKGKAVVYHGKVTHGFNILSRLSTRSFARKTAAKLNK